MWLSKRAFSRFREQRPLVVLFAMFVVSVCAPLWLPGLIARRTYPGDHGEWIYQGDHAAASYQGEHTDSFNKLVDESGKGMLELCWGFILIYVLSQVVRRGRAIEDLQKVLDNTLASTRQGQLTDRMIKATSQLAAADQQGGKQLELRLGGIYALERIARESPENHQSVMEILSAYLRHNLPSAASSCARSGEDQDIQAVLTVLARREHRFDSTALNLRGIAVPGANLPGAHLKKADLSEACLEGSSLAEVHLEGASLAGSSLEGAHLEEANLDGANMTGANLNGAMAYRAQLQRAELIDAHLQRAVLIGANLRKADLTRGRLQGAKLSGAHLEEAILVDARVENADLSRSFLQGANLSGAVGLTQEQVDSAFGDGTTLLPSGVSYPPYWSDSTIIVPVSNEASSPLMDARAKGTA